MSLHIVGPQYQDEPEFLLIGAVVLGRTQEFYRHARRSTNHRGEAEDLVAAAVLEVIRNYRRLLREGRLSSEQQIAKEIHRYIAWRAHNLGRGRLRDIDSDADVARLPVPGAPVPDWERYELLYAAMASLPSNMQRAIHARYYENRSIAEIAEELGITLQATRYLLAAALRQLRKAFRHDR
jgi:RNA polymerase sigma factor (sigma-70 family)